MYINVEEKDIINEKTFELLKWVVGIFIGLMAAMGGYIMFMHRKQSTENKDNREERIKANERTTEAINRNTDILSGLKTLLERKK